MKGWIEDAWTCVTAVAPRSMKVSEAVPVRFVLGCESIAGTGRALCQMKARRLSALALVLTMLGTPCVPLVAQITPGTPVTNPGEALQLGALIKQGEVAAAGGTIAQTQSKLQKATTFSATQAQWIKEIIIAYKAAQMARQIYQRVKTGDIGLLVTTILPALTITDSTTTSQGYGEQDTFVIRPVPNNDQRTKMQGQLGAHLTISNTLGSYFQGNFLDWFDVDCAMNFAGPVGMQIPMDVQMLEQLSQADAVVGWLFSQHQFNVLPDTVNANILASSAADATARQVALTVAYTAATNAMTVYGPNSGEYASALQSYYAALQFYTAPATATPFTIMSVAMKATTDQGLNLMELMAGDKLAMHLSATQGVNVTYNLNSIRKNYGSQNMTPLSAADLVDSSSSVKVNQETLAQAMMSNAYLGAILQQVIDINKKLYTESISLKQKQMEELGKQQGDVAYAAQLAGIAAEADTEGKMAVNSLNPLSAPTNDDGSPAYARAAGTCGVPPGAVPLGTDPSTPTQVPTPADGPGVDIDESGEDNPNNQTDKNVQKATIAMRTAGATAATNVVTQAPVQITAALQATSSAWLSAWTGLFSSFWKTASTCAGNVFSGVSSVVLSGGATTVTSTYAAPTAPPAVEATS